MMQEYMADRCRELCLKNEELKKERDAAVKDIERLMVEFKTMEACEYCDNPECGHSDKCEPKWRGVQTNE